MITSIHIQHYKSLSDVRIDFKEVNVLVGLNATGKSNVIDAIRFIKDAVLYDLDHAISDRGGIEVVRQYRRRETSSIWPMENRDFHG